MRFLIGLVLGLLAGMWLEAHNYRLRLPIERAATAHSENSARGDNTTKGSIDREIDAARGLLD